MPLKRESFYRCKLVSPESFRVAHVSAWDADEAVQLFRSELHTERVDEAGTIEVFRLGDPSEEQHGAYLPAAG